MATESEIENYSTLLSDTKIQGLKNVKQTYVDQISQAKTDLDKATFTDWEDSVSTKFKNHYDTLKTNYSTIATDVGEGSNLDTLITLVSGLKTKCDEYLGYRDEYNSISTGISFSNEKLRKEYNEYKNGKRKYTNLSLEVKKAISNNNSKVNRKKTLESLMSACSSTIDTTLTNIKSITFNASSESRSGIQTEFNTETAPQDNGHITPEQAREQFEASQAALNEFVAKLRAIDYNTPGYSDQVNKLLAEGGIEVLSNYYDSVFFLYLKGEISYDEFTTLSDMTEITIVEEANADLYDIIYLQSYGEQSEQVNFLDNRNEEYRTFAERFNRNGCSSQEFLQNVPPLSYFYQEGVDINYNNVEDSSKYAVASLVELLENGYTGGIDLAGRDSEGDIFRAFNNKAGDENWKNGFMDSAKEINHQYIDYYYNNGGAFNGPTETTE